LSVLEIKVGERQRKLFTSYLNFQEEKLFLESRLLLATQPPVCLEPQVAWRKLVKQVIINIQSKCRIFFFQLSGSTLEAQMCTWGTYSLLVDVAVMGTVSMEISFMTPDHLL